MISVGTVLKMCGLEKYAGAIVGSLGVEHKKRTTIGVELAAKVGSVEPHSRYPITTPLQAQITSLSRRTDLRT